MECMEASLQQLEGDRLALQLLVKGLQAFSPRTLQGRAAIMVFDCFALMATDIP